MTNLEMKNAFNVRYNAIASMSAPPIDDYELSLYLTKGQLELIKDYYDPNSNRKGKGFEGSEKRRVDLKELVKDYKTSISFTNPSAIHINSRFFNIPDEVFLSINENVKIISNDCLNDIIIKVKPTTHDEFDTQIKNPFKTPDDSIAWRLNTASIANNQVVEIVSPYNVTGNLEYRLRYIKYPKPIIITNLDTTFPNDDLTIEGLFEETECELHTQIHDEIVDRAVELCMNDYKSEKLQSKIQLDTRNE